MFVTSALLRGQLFTVTSAAATSKMLRLAAGGAAVASRVTDRPRQQAEMGHTEAGRSHSTAPRSTGASAGHKTGREEHDREKIRAAHVVRYRPKLRPPRPGPVIRAMMMMLVRYLSAYRD